MKNRIIRFDGKHWIGRKYYNEPIKIHSSDYVAQQVRKMLGEGGMVAIPEARSDDNRYEEVVDELSNGEQITNNGGIIYDKNHDIYFIKGQEINTQIGNTTLTFLFYNLHHGIGGNLNGRNGKEILEKAIENNAIIGINGPSCIKDLDKLSSEELNPLLKHVDFFVGHSGSNAIRLINNSSINFYEINIRKNESIDHQIGIIAVSGGHRTPKGFFDYLKNGFGQTIGTSYSLIDEPRRENFYYDLKNSLRNASLEDLTMNPIFAEMIFRHLPLGLLDKIRNR